MTSNQDQNAESAVDPIKSEHHEQVRRLWADWQYYEAAERGYDLKAASAARDAFFKAKKFYEAWYGEKWER